MPDITIPDAAVEAASKASYDHIHAEDHGVSITPWEKYHDKEWWRDFVRMELTAAAPHIAAQERQRVADEIDLPAVMAHLLRGSRDDLILADRINVAIGASRVRRIEAGNG